MRWSEQLLAALIHRDEEAAAALIHRNEEAAGTFTTTTRHGSAQPTNLNQKLAKHSHTATGGMQSTTAPVLNVDVTLVGTHVTPSRPIKPPEVATPTALLANNQ